MKSKCRGAQMRRETLLEITTTVVFASGNTSITMDTYDTGITSCTRKLDAGLNLLFVKRKASELTLGRHDDGGGLTESGGIVEVWWDIVTGLSNRECSS
uniref:Bm12917 n=1 Tax=Brugia malayi TaxID=6279 RepID=A0A1I9G612_BRUMA|nr:Bm12917 [Brugia malayi]